jgi:hypothetical protein
VRADYAMSARIRLLNLSVTTISGLVVAVVAKAPLACQSYHMEAGNSAAFDDRVPEEDETARYIDPLRAAVAASVTPNEAAANPPAGKESRLERVDRNRVIPILVGYPDTT